MKYAVTIAVTAAGKAEIIAGPNADVDAQVSALRKLTEAKGKLGKVQYAEAAILHTTKGTIKTRKF